MYPCSLWIVDDPDSLFEGSNATRPPPTAATSFCLGGAVFKIRKGSFIKNFVFGNHSFCLGEAVFEIRKRAFIQGFVLDNHLAFLIWPAVALVRTLYFPRRRNLYLFVKQNKNWTNQGEKVVPVSSFCNHLFLVSRPSVRKHRRISGTRGEFCRI